MEVKSLAELNRDFMAEKESQNQSVRSIPVKPQAIESGPPELIMGPPSGNTAANTDAAGYGRKKNRINIFRPGPARQCSKRESAKKTTAIFTFVSNAIFYLAVVLILLTVLTTGADAGVPKTIFGYSYYTVLSQSMQDEIPKGSFILVKSVNPQVIKAGDTITYMRDRNTSVTHKVVDIYENYNNSGSRGFQTMGVNNSAPDADIVRETSVVGKVVFVLPAVGAIMSSLAANVYLVFIIFGLCVVISFCLRGVFTKPSKKKLQEGL